MTHSNYISVRLAAAPDLTWCQQQDTHATPSAVERKLRDGELLIATLHGNPVGYLRLEFLWTKLAFIGLIMVPGPHRRRGVGRSLLRFVEDHLRNLGATMLLSSSQADEPEPQAWHRHMGFEECGYLTGINHGNIGEVFFRKQLTQTPKPANDATQTL